MPHLLGQVELLALRKLAHNGDRAEYYRTLADWGYAEARLSLGVVGDDTLVGKVANRYAEAAAGQKGYRFSLREWIRISNELMMGDYNARAAIVDSRQAEQGTGAGIDATLSYDQYRSYHAAVFDGERWGKVGIEIWTPHRLVGSRSTGALADIMWASLRASAGWRVLLPVGFTLFSASLLLLLVVWAVNAPTAKNPFVDMKCTRRDVVAALRMLWRDKNFFDPERKYILRRKRLSRRR